MVKSGYNNDDFNQISICSNDSKCSSQEGLLKYKKFLPVASALICHYYFVSLTIVLIACAWLISTHDIVFLLLSKTNSIFEQEYFKDFSQTENELNKIEIEKKHLLEENEKTNQSNLSTLKLNYLKKLEHNFKSKLNSLHSCLRERSKLTHEV